MNAGRRRRSLALGLLVGVQRGWVQRNAIDGRRFAGVRTFGLTGLAVAAPAVGGVAFNRRDLVGA